MKIHDKVAVVRHVGTAALLLRLRSQAGLTPANARLSLQLSADVLVGVLDDLHRQSASFVQGAGGGGKGAAKNKTSCHLVCSNRAEDISASSASHEFCFL